MATCRYAVAKIKGGRAGRKEHEMFHRENRRQYFGRLIADSERQKDRSKSRPRKKAKKK